MPMNNQSEVVVNSTVTRPPLVGATQTLVLIMPLAWAEGGGWWVRFLATLYFLGGTLRAISNFLLFCAIIRQKALRKCKEYILMSYMALFDLWESGWYITSAIFVYGTQTRLSCFFQFRHFFYHFLGTQSAVGMLVMASVDRLLCVSFPVWYWNQGKNLAHKYAGIAFGWACIFGCYYIHPVISWPNDPIPFCFTSHTFRPASEVEAKIREVLLVASACIYFLVVVIFRYKGKARLSKVAEVGQRKELEERYKKFNEMQRSMTITLGFSAMVTLFLYIIPFSSWTYLRVQFPSLQQYGWVLLVPVNLSCVANIFLFAYRHKEVRMAIGAFFRWKSMPSNLKDWDIQNVAQTMETKPVRVHTTAMTHRLQ